jgi:pimeloyl-ACP methyl ester carboxylesterase
VPRFSHEGIDFHYRDTGEGIPFIFQHGLGGDVDQPFGLFTPSNGIRLLAFDCRAHGETRPTGNEEKIGIRPFVDDLKTFLDHLEIDEAIIGGISMGAAITLSFALRFPQRVRCLVQVRPAWLEGPNQDNALVFGKIARLLREEGPECGKTSFLASQVYRETLDKSPDSANSLLGQFDSPRAIDGVARLERIPLDSVCAQLAELQDISVPTLVLANRQDTIHPFEFGPALADAISKGRFSEITPKSVSVEKYEQDVQRSIAEFIADVLKDDATHA